MILYINIHFNIIPQSNQVAQLISSSEALQLKCFILFIFTCVLHAFQSHYSSFNWRVKSTCYGDLTHCRHTGSGSETRHILDFGTGWRWAVCFTLRSLCTPRNDSWYPLDRRLGWLQSWSGRGGQEKKIPTPDGDRTRKPLQLELLRN
jgi:hypothetical protein